MEKKYRILGEFIKDISAETKDVESYIYTKENISKFKLFIDISTKPLKILKIAILKWFML